MSEFIRYDKNGEVTLSINDDEVFAKSKDEIFYAKKCTAGPDASHLLNPNSMWFVEGSEKAKDGRAGRKIYEYKKVTPGCFKLYLKFLQTKNPAYLRNAEREIQ